MGLFKKRESNEQNQIGIVIKDATNMGYFSHRKWDTYTPTQKRNVLIFGFVLLLAWLGSFVYFYFMPSIHNFFNEIGKGVTDPAQNWLITHVPSLFDTLVCIAAFLSIFYVLKFVKNIIRFKSQKSKTIFGLVISVCNYILFIVYLLIALGGWGANVATMVASAGIITLIISFGSQSLVEDLFTGVVMAIEGNISVGDIVIFDGFVGTVREIGLRVTKIESIKNHIMIARNSELKKVINTSKNDSYNDVEFKVKNKFPTAQIDELFLTNIGNIKGSNKDIATIKYIGVTKFDNLTTSFMLVFTCKNNRALQCENSINKYVNKLFEENGINRD